MSTYMDIVVRARDEASAVFKGLGQTASTTASGFSRVSAGMRNVGSTLTRTVTPAAAGAAVVFAQAGKTWDEAVRTLSLGNTRKEFQGLIDSAKRVSGQVTQPLNEVADAMDQLSDRTGLTGKPLETLTKRFLELEHISGESAASTIPAITRLFGDWSVKTKDQADTMDYLMRASEATGISVGQLSTQMVQFGSPLRQLGFTFDETAAMFSKFEKEGVNVQTALPGLRMALKNLSAPTGDLQEQMKKLGVEAKEPKDRLVEFFDVIKKMPSTAKANALAFQVFGTRAGPDMAAAIREGRFNLKDLIDTVKNGKATIQSATKHSRSFGDTIAMWKNKVMVAIGPFGDIGAAILGAVAGMGPLLMALSTLPSAIGAVGGAFSKVFALFAANPWMILVAALIIVIVLIVKHWDKVKKYLLVAWHALQKAWSVVWNAIKTAAIAVWNAIKTAFNVWWTAMKAPVVAYFTFWKAVWNGLKTAAVVVWHAIRDAASTFFGWLKDGWRAVSTIGRGIWDGILNAAKAVFNAIAYAWNHTVGLLSFHVPSWVPKIGGMGFDVPDIPYLAEGGIVTKATLAVLGEAGPEAVIPLSRLGSNRATNIIRLDRRRFVDELSYDATYRGWG